MKKTRAAAVAVIGLALSATVAYAARPNTDKTNVAQVTQADPSESPEASEAPDPSESPEASESPDGSDNEAAGAQGEHGAAVSAVAQDETAVGGKNNNHGGAVSAVARGDHGPSTAASAKAKTHGKSAAHRP